MVIAVLTLLVGISLAGLAGIGTVRQQSETNRIASMMRFAYSRAISDGLYVRMRMIYRRQVLDRGYSEPGVSTYRAHGRRRITGRR